MVGRMMCGAVTSFVWEGITQSVVPRHAPSALLDHTAPMGRFSAAWKGSTLLMLVPPLVYRVLQVLTR